MGSTPGSGRSPRGGNGTSLQYSCLENPVDRGAWWASVHGVTESDTLRTQAWMLVHQMGLPVGVDFFMQATIPDQCTSPFPQEVVENNWRTLSFVFLENQWYALLVLNTPQGCFLVK